MSQFTLLVKRPTAGDRDLPAMRALPAICILEQLDDGHIYVWPLQRTFFHSVALDPSDALDSLMLLNGEFITYSGYFYSVPDYLSRNGLPLDLFYRMHIGEFQGISDARDMLSTLKALL